jgi:hypothetical protein
MPQNNRTTPKYIQMQGAGRKIFGSDRPLIPTIRYDKKLYPKRGNDKTIKGFNQKAEVR